MNKFQKVISTRAILMEDVIYMILNDEYGMCGGYDYNENSLFKLCKSKLSKSLKKNTYTIEDVKEMNSSLYMTLMRPLCEDIAKSYYNKLR